MQKGFNSDIYVNGSTFHVQTEDWGAANPFIVTQIFKGGAVVKSIKTPYAEIWKPGSKHIHKFDHQAIRMAMQVQHQEILDQLVHSQN